MTVKKVTTAVFLALLSILFFSCSSDGGNEEESTSSSSLEIYWNPDISYGMLTDTRDGNTYRTVEIGSQTWMAENLNYNASGSKCYYDNEANCNTYGRLYDWATAMNIDAVYNSSLWGGSDVNHQGICPAGWHLSSDTEWAELIEDLGTSAGTKLKAKSGWDNSGNGTDDYGFSALPGGFGISGSFGDVDYSGFWWSATESYAGDTYNRGMYYDYENVDRYYNDKYYWLSVRCLRD